MEGLQEKRTCVNRELPNSFSLSRATNLPAAGDSTREISGFQLGPTLPASVRQAFRHAARQTPVVTRQSQLWMGRERYLARFDKNRPAPCVRHL